VKAVEIKSTVKPKWFQLRFKLSNLFMSVARLIYPQNPDIRAFYVQLMMDQLIYGESIIRVNPKDVNDQAE
jgi:hypothetical protein